MKTGRTDHQDVTARQLFDIHARIERARSDLETAAWHYDLACAAALHAKVRLELAETPLAQIESCDAHARMRDLEQIRDEAQAKVAELERLKDGLLSKLVS